MGLGSFLGQLRAKWFDLYRFPLSASTDSHGVPMILVCARARARVCVCVFIKLHITAQSGLVILVILCHSH